MSSGMRFTTCSRQTRASLSCSTTKDFRFCFLAASSRYSKDAFAMKPHLSFSYFLILFQFPNFSFIATTPTTVTLRTKATTPIGTQIGLVTPITTLLATENFSEAGSHLLEQARLLLWRSSPGFQVVPRHSCIAVESAGLESHEHRKRLVHVPPILQ